MIKAPVAQHFSHLRHLRVEVWLSQLAEYRLVLIQRAAVGDFLVMDIIEEYDLVFTFHQL